AGVSGVDVAEVHRVRAAQPSVGVVSEHRAPVLAELAPHHPAVGAFAHAMDGREALNAFQHLPQLVGARSLQVLRGWGAALGGSDACGLGLWVHEERGTAGLKYREIWSDAGQLVHQRVEQIKAQRTGEAKLNT